MNRQIPVHNSSYPKGGDWCSKDSFVVNGTLVFQIHFCGKNPALRVAAKRYAILANHYRRQGVLKKLPPFQFERKISND